MTYDETLAHIFSRGRFGMKPGLERVTEILARLGNPHLTLKAVQIAGTKKEITVSHLHFDNISSWPETDRLVYILYGLTDEEINLVEGSR